MLLEARFMRQFIVYLILLVSLSACSTAIKTKPQQEKLSSADSNALEVQGNLRPTQILNCVDIKELSNQNTPADMYSGFDACMIEENYQKANRLRNLALLYGYYDTLRVADPTARRAIKVLDQRSLKTHEDKIAAFNTYVKENKQLDKKYICEFLYINGAPSYYPNYMIYHGLDIFGELRGTGVSLDTEPAWVKMMQQCQQDKNNK